MDLFDAFSKRISYRGAYLPGTVPHASLKRIVEAAYSAPSGCNRQTTRIVAVTDPGRIQTVSELLTKPNVANAGALLVLAFDPSEEYGVEDCSAACENAMLAIAATGYASCWLDGVLRRENRAEKIAELFKIPSPFRVRIVLPVGRPAAEPVAPEKRAFNERAFLDSFGTAF
jgi:nitroreductase